MSLRKREIEINRRFNRIAFLERKKWHFLLKLYRFYLRYFTKGDIDYLINHALYSQEKFIFLETVGRDHISELEALRSRIAMLKKSIAGTKSQYVSRVKMENQLKTHRQEIEEAIEYITKFQHNILSEIANIANQAEINKKYINERFIKLLENNNEHT